MYAKIENGVLKQASRRIKSGDKQIINPAETDLLAAGYLPVEASAFPEVPEGYHAEERFVQKENKIVQEWAIVAGEEGPKETL